MLPALLKTRYSPAREVEVLVLDEVFSTAVPASAGTWVPITWSSS